MSFLKFIFLKFIFVYQKVFTLLDFGSCRFYPCCSEYAKITIKYNSLFKALLYSGKRLLKCNQYFDGGLDYPIVSMKIVNINKYILEQSSFNITNIQAWLICVDECKKELYWISNFTTKIK